MQQKNGPVSSIENDEIDLKALIGNLWLQRKFIATIVVTVTALAVVVAFLISDIYRADSKLAPAEDDSSALAGLAAQFSGLASLAGVDLGSSSTSKTTIAIETLKSRQFITEFVHKHDILIDLFAIKKWNMEENKLTLDDDVYDENAKKWVRDVDPPYQPKPSDLEAYESFLDILSVSQDTTTGLLSISIDHKSPHVARQWLDWLLADINDFMRKKDIEEAENSIVFLKDQLTKTSVADMQTVLYQLIETQVRTITLANVRKDYAFKEVDPPVDAEEPVKPNRIVISIAGFMLSVMMAIIAALIRSRMLTGK